MIWNQENPSWKQPFRYGRPYAIFAHSESWQGRKMFEFVPTFCRIMDRSRNERSGSPIPCIISNDWGYVDTSSSFETCCQMVAFYSHVQYLHHLSILFSLETHFVGRLLDTRHFIYGIRKFPILSLFFTCAMLSTFIGWWNRLNRIEKSNRCRLSVVGRLANGIWSSKKKCW